MNQITYVLAYENQLIDSDRTRRLNGSRRTDSRVKSRVSRDSLSEFHDHVLRPTTVKFDMIQYQTNHTTYCET